MVVFMRGLSERPPYTQKRNHHRLFTFCLLHDLSLLPGGGSYVLVMFDNESFKRVANVMLVYLFTWEMLRSHTGVYIFCNSVNAWERREARVILVLLLVLKLMRIFLIATFQ